MTERMLVGKKTSKKNLENKGNSFFNVFLEGAQDNQSPWWSHPNKVTG